jgi:hypothetical protein
MENKKTFGSDGVPNLACRGLMGELGVIWLLISGLPARRPQSRSAAAGKRASGPESFSEYRIPDAIECWLCVFMLHLQHEYVAIAT